MTQKEFSNTQIGVWYYISFIGTEWFAVAVWGDTWWWLEYERAVANLKDLFIFSSARRGGLRWMPAVFWSR